MLIYHLNVTALYQHAMVVSYYSILLRCWSKSRGGVGGLEENGGWVSKFRALAKGVSPQISASGGVWVMIVSD